MKKILVLTIVTIPSCAVYFFYNSLIKLSTDSQNEAINNLSIEIIGSLVFGIIVTILALFFGEEWKKYKKNNELKSEISKLKKTIKLVFKRNKTSLNIQNLTPSFYLDLSRINPLYDTLTNNNSEWETKIEEFYELNKSNKLVKHLLKFIELVEETKICLERIDTNIREKYLEPSQAATLNNTTTMIEFYLLRSTILSATETDIFFKIRSISNRNISFQQVQYSKTNLQNLISSNQKLGAELRIFIHNKRKILKIIHVIEEIIKN